MGEGEAENLGDVTQAVSASDPYIFATFDGDGSTEQKLFILGSHPLVRVRPGVPLKYRSGGWDFGWLMARTDGHVVYRRCDPYTLSFSDHRLQRAVRWFVR